MGNNRWRDEAKKDWLSEVGERCCVERVVDGVSPGVACFGGFDGAAHTHAPLLFPQGRCDGFLIFIF